MSPSSVNISNLTGKQGGQVIDNASGAVTLASGQNFHALLVVAETVMSAVTSNLTADTKLVGLTLPVGLVIYGRFQAITISSGTVIAYRE